MGRVPQTTGPGPRRDRVTSRRMRVAKFPRPPKTVGHHERKLERGSGVGESPPPPSSLVGQFSGGGKAEILVLNQGGQLLLWADDGTAIGSGQDGLVAQLPAGRWTTTPTEVEFRLG